MNRHTARDFCVRCITRTKITVLVTFLAIILTAAPSFAQKKLYWQTAAGGNNVVLRSNLDGTNIETILTSVGDAGGNGINYLTHSVDRQKLYFTTADPNPGLYQSDFEGNNVQQMQAFPYSSFPRGIAVNEVTDRLYWTSNHGSASATNSKVRSVTFDNTGLQDLVSLADGTYPYGMAVDAAAGKLYWAEHGFNQIVRANLDGTGRQVILTGVQTYSLALDAAAGKLYWPDNAAQAVRRADITGANVQSIAPFSQLSLDSGITLDTAAGHVYWSNSFDHRIYRADLDGSDLQIINPSVPYAQSLAVIVVPEPSSVAVCAVAALVGVAFIVVSRRRSQPTHRH